MSKSGQGVCFTTAGEIGEFLRLYLLLLGYDNGPALYTKPHVAGVFYHPDQFVQRLESQDSSGEANGFHPLAAKEYIHIIPAGNLFADFLQPCIIKHEFPVDP